jgi:hypothetical protein
VGTLLNAVGYTIDTWEFWCFLATYWAVERLGRIAGVTEGVIKFLSMPDNEQEKIKKLLKESMK